MLQRIDESVATRLNPLELTDAERAEDALMSGYSSSI
jgi:hypothetical protein